jgi:hypothetical protein
MNEKEGRALLAERSKQTVAELKRMILHAEAGRLPVFVAVYQIIPASGDGGNGHGVMAHVIGPEAWALAAVGQLHSVMARVVGSLPEGGTRIPQAGAALMEAIEEILKAERGCAHAHLAFVSQLRCPNRGRSSCVAIRPAPRRRIVRAAATTRERGGRMPSRVAALKPK